ncbi:iron ABC transporter permease [Cobetia amphilecti]|uniref:FecCD family ABC transporter permease n=1 Tax=Cobetia amphilecti TaxID=1055104 RepID=UPI001CDB3357|nr:iron ABC transporter permease [Cobetia amphilecti]UBU48853.1 iron ABC transporter permease [Cobetia amphilecti]
MSRPSPLDPLRSAPTGTLWWRHGKLSLLLLRAPLLAAGILLLALLMASVASLMLGSAGLGPWDAFKAAFGHGEFATVFVVQELRLPRLLAGIATGAAFSLAGCLMQTLAGNRLATPGIIGIDNGATAFAVASVVGMGISLAPPVMALSGAVIATALAFGLSGGIGTRGYRFLVAGIGVGALFGAGTQLMLARVSIDAANSAYPWTVGSLNARDADSLTWLGLALLIGVPIALWLGRGLNTLRFTDRVATGLGQPVSRVRLITLWLSVVLTAAAVAVAGPVGMVALVGPEIARYLSRHKGVPLLASALAGALVMVLADLAGRTLLSPQEIPVGIVMAVVGSPYLLWILLRSPR